MSKINSMTGFGRVEMSVNDSQLLWEVRSVNHRYLEIQMKLPDVFRVMEPDFRQLIGGKIKRGKVDAALTLKKGGNGHDDMTLDKTRARLVINHLESISAEIKNPAPLNPADVLRSPGVLGEDSIDAQTIAPVVLGTLESAIDELCDSRAREGLKLQRMLEERCVEIVSVVEKVRERLPTVLKEIRKKLMQRVESLEANLDNERLEQELVIIAQKLDVSEELDRLDAHIDEVRSAINDNQPVGRRLDFLMQELNREANTLGSKSADSETTQKVVDLKVLIEQMREQVQNVE
jgi:uncharacterized protein (TIGR00255 family)